METLPKSEFADEYQDWLEGNPGAKRAPWFDFPVGELERGTLLKVEPHTPVREVVRLMNEHHRGAVLVMRGDELVGIFTERDVLRRVVPHSIDIDRTSVGELMTTTPDVLPEWATLAQALRVMAQCSYRHLPVVDSKGRPIAMVSMRSIISFVSETFPNEILNAPPEKQRFLSRVDGG